MPVKKKPQPEQFMSVNPNFTPAFFTPASGQGMLLNKGEEPAKPKPQAEPERPRGVPLTAQRQEGEGKKAFAARLKGEGQISQESEGTLTAEEVGTEKKRREEIAESLGEEVPPSELLGDFSEKATLTVGGLATAIGAAASAAGVVGGGAVLAGAVASAPVLAPIAAGAALVATLYVLLNKNRKKAVKDSFGALGIERGEIYSSILNNANNPNISRTEVIQAYNVHLANLHEIDRRLTNLAWGKEGQELENAQLRLNAIRTYLKSEPERRAEVFNALINPDPTKVSIPIPIPEEPESGGLFG